jgi:DNA replication and repair protein RecF
MRLRACHLEDFRNIASARLVFPCEGVFLRGSNGQGKSNLLEAIALLHAFRSFRSPQLPPLIRQGSRQARIFYRAESGGVTHEVLFELKRGEGRRILLDGEPVERLADWLARFPSVVLAQADLGLVRGSPAERRRLLDLHFSTTHPDYYRHLRAYHRALRARNRLLKDRSAPGLLRAYDHPLAEAAAQLCAVRERETGRLAPVLSSVFAAIAGRDEGPELAFAPGSTARTVEEFLALWEEQRERDLGLRSTQYGPHRDDWILRLQAGAARTYGSDGQQRNLVLALKLGLHRDLAERTGRTPLLLADDVLGELDPDRRRAFWQWLPEACQVFATGTEELVHRGGRDWTEYLVTEGTFAPQGPGSGS